MVSGKRGFTIIEMLIVIALGVILTQMAVKGFGTVSDQMSAREARNVFQGMLARTRAQAIESGMQTMFLVDTKGDSLMIFANGEIAETVRLSHQMGVDLQPEMGLTRICMTPRGFANPDCNSFSSTLKLVFKRGTKQEEIEILPMGQVLW